MSKKTNYFLIGYDDNGKIVKVFTSYDEAAIDLSISRDELYHIVSHCARSRKIHLRLKLFNEGEEILQQIEPYDIHKKTVKQNAIGFIYKIVNDVNNKVFIGKTINDNLSHVFSIHKINAKNGSNRKLHQAMREIGFTHFDIKIIDACLISELSKRCVYWLNKYNAIEEGYNTQKSNDQEMLSYNPISILAYDARTGNFYKEFNSITDAVRKLKLKQSAISGIFAVLDIEERVAYDYMWRKKINNNYPLRIMTPEEIKINNQQKKIKETLTFIKNNVGYTTIDDIKNKVQNNKEFCTWNHIIKYIHTNDKKLYNIIAKHRKIDKNTGWLLLNIKTLETHRFFNQEDIAIFLQHSQANISKYADKKNIFNNKYLIFSYKKYLTISENNMIKQYIIDSRYRTYPITVINSKTNEVSFFENRKQIENKYNLTSRTVRNILNCKYGCYHPVQGPNTYLIVIPSKKYVEFATNGLDEFIQEQIKIDPRKELQINGKIKNTN